MEPSSVISRTSFLQTPFFAAFVVCVDATVDVGASSTVDVGSAEGGMLTAETLLPASVVQLVEAAGVVVVVTACVVSAGSSAQLVVLLLWLLLP
jgi:hypothetical protein